MPQLKWAYGVTTVPGRRDTLLRKTLRSLTRAGFPRPRLFVDGDADPGPYAALADTGRGEAPYEVTCRYPAVLAAGNWVLSAYELYVREPEADRYVVFQDDLLCVCNLRQYLEACRFPDCAYLNLYQAPSNFKIVPKDEGGAPRPGWYPSNQFGRGALALVFTRAGLIETLTSSHLVNRFWDAPYRGYKAVDGGVVDSMRKAGYEEWVHHPSLVLHTGKQSTVNKSKTATRHDPVPNGRPYEWPPFYDGSSFPGEDCDALGLLARIPPDQVLDRADPNNSTGPRPPEGVTGAAVYDGYPESVRKKLVAAWRAEIGRVLEAIRLDQERAEAASTGGPARRQEARRYYKAIERYKGRLADLERNNPPFYGPEVVR